MIIFARFIVISLHSGPVIINDRLITVIFLGEGGQAQKMRRPNPHLGRNFAKKRTRVDGGGRGSYFRVFYVDVINVCSLIRNQKTPIFRFTSFSVLSIGL